MYLKGDDQSPRQYPKVPLERRAYAFLLDFVTVWLTSSFFSGMSQVFVFLIAWFALRVVLVEKNQGQSLGRWAFDMRIIDLRYNFTPGLAALSKREAILGLCALLAMIGLNINLKNPLSLLILITPLLIDCGMALGDEQSFLAFHDRMAQTVIIQSRRGFSLDLRLKKLWYVAKRKLQRRK